MADGCPKLRNLHLDHLKLRILDLQLAPNLSMLSLNECKELVELQMADNTCSKLTYFYLKCSKLRTLDLQMTPNLDQLHVEKCYKLVELHLPVDGCSKLGSLYLGYLKLRSLDLRLSPNLQVLDIQYCHNLEQLQMPVGCSELRIVNLRHSLLRNLDLGMAPNLEKLHIKECHDLVQHDAPVACVNSLECIDLSGRLRLKSFDLEKKWGSSMFHLSAESIDICPFNTDHRLPKFRFSCNYDEQEQPSSATVNRQKLVSLANCCYRNFTSFPESICRIQSLRQLTLHGSIPEMPKHLEKLEYLEELFLSSIETKHLPDSICMLKRLKSLKLKSCLLLEKLPKDIGRLECIEILVLKDCTSLTDIPISICNMKRLKMLSLAFCTHVEKLPEELGCLECLRMLYVEGTSINWLPNSISLSKGLRVAGSQSLLQSCGFASQIQEVVVSDKTFCYIRIS